MNINFIVSIFALANSVFFCYAGEPLFNSIKKEKCGAVNYSNYLKSKNPALQEQIVRDENILQQVLRNSTASRISNTIYTIPVVVHVVYFSDAQNISDAQVQSQIDVLNEDFSRTNADTINTPPPFASVASSTNFQFCLARRDPNGNPTSGIERRQTTVQVFQANDGVKFYSSGGLNAWDVNKYLNIWVCDLGGDILGFAEAPSSFHSNVYGLVVQYNAFGRIGSVNAPYNYGRTCTHEISHCFDLNHIWGDEDLCSGSDLVDDTPNQAESTFGCHSFSFSDICTQNYPGIMYMNYMDYSDDDCMNMFTNDQAMRMFAAVNFFYPTLLTSNGCLANGIASLPDFEFGMYPNPSSGILQIKILTSANIGSKANIRISNVLGKNVYKSIILNPNTGTNQLDLQQLNSGIYFVTIFNDNFQKTERVIIKK